MGGQVTAQIPSHTPPLIPHPFYNNIPTNPLCNLSPTLMHHHATNKKRSHHPLLPVITIHHHHIPPFPSRTITNKPTTLSALQLVGVMRGGCLSVPICSSISAFSKRRLHTPLRWGTAPLLPRLLALLRRRVSLGLQHNLYNTSSTTHPLSPYHTTYNTISTTQSLSPYHTTYNTISTTHPLSPYHTTYNTPYNQHSKTHTTTHPTNNLYNTSSVTLSHNLQHTLQPTLQNTHHNTSSVTLSHNLQHTPYHPYNTPYNTLAIPLTPSIPPLHPYPLIPYLPR